jgi:hypothetical protein
LLINQLIYLIIKKIKSEEVLSLINFKKDNTTNKITQSHDPYDQLNEIFSAFSYKDIDTTISENKSNYNIRLSDSNEIFIMNTNIINNIEIEFKSDDCINDYHTFNNNDVNIKNDHSNIIVDYLPLFDNKYFSSLFISSTENKIDNDIIENLIIVINNY